MINSRTLCVFHSERGDLGAGASYQWTAMIRSEVPLKRKFTDTIKRVIWFIQTIVLGRSLWGRPRFSSRQFLSPFGTKPFLGKKRACFIYLNPPLAVMNFSSSQSETSKFRGSISLFLSDCLF